ncbi:hypothetical protein FPC831_10003 [Flavobacterium psychrophilum]|nr:hypothetical protein IY37_06930 [Flavobacterium psychrophilum]SNB00284.1 hypothetical protein FPC831_10003 [Flavobacterium psychrophilum]
MVLFLLFDWIFFYMFSLCYSLSFVTKVVPKGKLSLLIYNSFVFFNIVLPTSKQFFLVKKETNLQYHLQLIF